MSSLLPLKRNADCISQEEIVIRPMQTNEISKVLQLELDGLIEFCESEEHVAATRTFHEKRENRVFKMMEKDCLNHYPQYNRKVWVAVKGTNVLGSIAIKPRMYKKLADRSSAEIYNMYVIKDQRGTGLAQQLIQTAERHCKREKIKALHLTTQDNLTRAIRFYEKVGYSLTHEKKWDSYQLLYYKKDL